MNDGWIKLHRKIKDWEWFSNANTLALWLHILFMANWEDKKWQGKVIKRGSFITSLQHLSDACGLSFQQTRTALRNMQNTGEITSKSTNKFTLITVNKYDDYQLKLTNDQQTNNKQITTTKEVKEIKNILSITPNQLKSLQIMFPNKNIKEELLKANDHLRAEGLEKKNYLAWFRNWLRRDFNNYKSGGRHVRRISIAPIPE